MQCLLILILFLNCLALQEPSFSLDWVATPVKEQPRTRQASWLISSSTLYDDLNFWSEKPKSNPALLSQLHDHSCPNPSDKPLCCLLMRINQCVRSSRAFYTEQKSRRFSSQNPQRKGCQCRAFQCDRGSLIICLTKKKAINKILEGT